MSDITLLHRLYVKKKVMFHFVGVKIVYIITVEYIVILQCVPDIMPQLHLCIWHHYKDKYIIWWERKYHSCMLKCNPAAALWYKYLIVWLLHSLPLTLTASDHSSLLYPGIFLMKERFIHSAMLTTIAPTLSHAATFVSIFMSPSLEFSMWPREKKPTLQT